VTLVWVHLRAATLELLRYPSFSVPTLLFPTVLFLAWGSRTGMPANLALASYAAFAVLGVGVSGLVRRAEGASAVITALYLPLSFISGAFFLGPESGRIGKLIAERGGVDDEIGGRIERLLLYSRVELALIALIAMDMVIKPGV